MKQLSVSINEKLETMIDGSKLSIVLAAMADVCADKAEHIRSNWQDDVTASHWEIMSNKLGKLAGQTHL